MTNPNKSLNEVPIPSLETAPEIVSPESAEAAQHIATLSTNIRGVFEQALPSHPEWNDILKTHGRHPFMVISNAQQKGVPQNLIDRYVWNVIADYMKKNDAGFVVRFLTNTKLGTPGLIAVFEALDRLQLEALKRKRELQAVNAPPPQRPKNTLFLPPNATLADLKAAYNNTPLTEEADTEFWLEIGSTGFDAVSQLLEAWSGPDAATTKVVDFLDVSSLPIVFGERKKKERRKKPST